jgi:hypothetical protein
MMSRTDEPLEGVVFDVQDHARRTGTRGSVHMGRWLARTSMGLKSPPDGRWDGRGRTGLWRALAQRRRRTPSLGRFGRDLAYGDQPFTDGTLTLMIRTPPGQLGRFLEHVAACWASLARVAGCRSPRRGNVLLTGWCLCPNRANVSPLGAWRLIISSVLAF